MDISLVNAPMMKVSDIWAKMADEIAKIKMAYNPPF